MKTTILELRRQQNELLSEARTIHNKGVAENRALTADEQKRWNELTAQTEQKQQEIEREERLALFGGQQQPAQGGQPQPVAQQQPNPSIGMSQRDLGEYRLSRALLALADRDWRNAGLELEASRATAKKLGRDPQGFFVPWDWMQASGRQLYNQQEQRDMLKGTPSMGGFLIQTDLLSQNFIELLRNRMVVRQAGAVVLSGLIGDVQIPRQTGSSTMFWINPETTDVTESQPAVGQVAMVPKTGGAMTDISRKLLLQSSIDAEMFVRDDLMRVIALGIDRAALHGSGTTPEPAGVANMVGIGSVAGGANGLAPTWGHVVGLESEVAIDNADVGRLGYITNARVRGRLKQAEKAASTGMFVWNDDGSMNGYSAYVTNQVRSDLTKGTSSGVCSAIFFGNWADLLIGQWGVMDMIVDPYTQAARGTLRIVALQDVDIVSRRVESFSAMLDALTV
jgi:HK97 family phage major capsid protein